MSKYIYIHINCTVKKTTALYFCVSMNQEAAILQHGGWTPFRSPASSHRPTSPLLRMLFDGSVIVKFVVTILGTFGDDTQKNISGHAKNIKKSQLVMHLEVIIIFCAWSNPFVLPPCFVHGSSLLGFHTQSSTLKLITSLPWPAGITRNNLHQGWGSVGSPLFFDCHLPSTQNNGGSLSGAERFLT